MYQKSTDFLVPRAPFRRLLRELILAIAPRECDVRRVTSLAQKQLQAYECSQVPIVTVDITAASWGRVDHGPGCHGCCMSRCAPDVHYMLLACRGH
jgi:hypothetical protein